MTMLGDWGAPLGDLGRPPHRHHGGGGWSRGGGFYPSWGPGYYDQAAYYQMALAQQAQAQNAAQVARVEAAAVARADAARWPAWVAPVAFFTLGLGLAYVITRRRA